MFSNRSVQHFHYSPICQVRASVLDRHFPRASQLPSHSMTSRTLKITRRRAANCLQRPSTSSSKHEHISAGAYALCMPDLPIQQESAPTSSFLNLDASHKKTSSCAMPSLCRAHAQETAARLCYRADDKASCAEQEQNPSIPYERPVYT
jgi:hypothetical protein